MRRLRRAVGRARLRLSAELYGCEVLAERVEDRADNLTRFVWLAPGRRAGRRRPTGFAKTSIVFWGFNDESPGALVEVLRELSDRGINLTKIESRPAAGGARPLHVLRRPRRARAATRTWPRPWRRSASACETLRMLGSYPRLTGVTRR